MWIEELNHNTCVVVYHGNHLFTGTWYECSLFIQQFSDSTIENDTTT
jgi:hypothetical protein